MKLSLYISGAVALMVVSGFFVAQIPAVQDLLVQKVAGKMMTKDLDDLFTGDALHAVICGSSAPMPIKGRAAACIMVIAGDKFYIVDTGNRSSNNLALWRIPSSRVGAVLLTHFHSDHIGDLGEFNMMTWAQKRNAPLDVYGPKGVKQVVEGFNLAYSQDRSYRTAHHGEEYLDPAIGHMIAKEVSMEGDSVTVLDDGDLKITMFVVDHAPIFPAVGYRFDYKGRSVVVSGDTVKTENVVKYSKDADVLFHEVLFRHIVKTLEHEANRLGNHQIEKIMLDVQNYHTSPVEAAEVANEANVKELSLYHLAPSPPTKLVEWVYMRGVSKVRSTGVTLGYDGLTYTLPIGSEDIYTEDMNDR